MRGSLGVSGEKAMARAMFVAVAKRPMGMRDGDVDGVSVRCRGLVDASIRFDREADAVNGRARPRPPNRRRGGRVRR